MVTSVTSTQLKITHYLMTQRTIISDDTNTHYGGFENYGTTFLS